MPFDNSASYLSDLVHPDHSQEPLLSRLRQLDQRMGVRFAVATDSQRCGMSGKSPVSASEDQRSALAALAGSRDRGEADRARAILLTLSGWTSPRIAEAFGVREDTVRLWRSDFSRGGTEALKASVAPGPPPVKSEAALRAITPLLEEPVTNRPNWTIARMRAEIEVREGVRISRSQLSKALRKKVPLPAAAAHAERAASCQRGRSDRLASATARAAGRSRRHRSALWR
jgi:transposase